MTTGGSFHQTLISPIKGNELPKLLHQDEVRVMFLTPYYKGRSNRNPTLQKSIVPLYRTANYGQCSMGAERQQYFNWRMETFYLE